MVHMYAQKSDFFPFHTTEFSWSCRNDQCQKLVVAEIKSL